METWLLNALRCAQRRLLEENSVSAYVCAELLAGRLQGLRNNGVPSEGLEQRFQVALMESFGQTAIQREIAKSLRAVLKQLAGSWKGESALDMESLLSRALVTALGRAFDDASERIFRQCKQGREQDE